MTHAALIVAHPDDEVLFCGSLMAAHPNWDWTLVSLTAGERESQFPGIVLGHADEWRILTVAEYESWRASLLALDLHPDIVFSHNLLGEYGHPHHMAVHRMAHELYPVVWDFLVEAPSSIGAQRRGAQVWELPVDPGKKGRFVDRYGPRVLEMLASHQPELIAEVFRREQFTA